MIAIDPGEHIGIVYGNFEESKVEGLTIEGDKRNLLLWNLLEKLNPDLIVYESFALRQSAAMKMVGSKFITIEVIGVIKLYCQLKNKNIMDLLPFAKKYCGFTDSPKDPKYKEINMVDNQLISEHTRDAYRLYNYYKLFGKKLQ